MLAEWSRRRSALTQLRVQDVEAPQLSRDQDHHVRRVLRGVVGEEIVVTNGRGSWRFCQIGEVELHVDDVVHVDPEPVRTTLYLAPLKGDRSEWALHKAVEVGVTHVVPLICRRLAVKFSGEARNKTLARWRRIAEEASGQCRRSYDLVVQEPVAVADVAPDVAVADFSGSGDWSDVTAVAIGPEGGFDHDEWDVSQRRLSLGPTVLRAETAAVVAGSLMAMSHGGWGFTLAPPKIGNDGVTHD